MSMDDSIIGIIVVPVVLILIVIGIAFYVGSIRNDNLSKFKEKCFNVDGIVLTNATGSGKTRSYSYVCVDPSIIKNID